MNKVKDEFKFSELVKTVGFKYKSSANGTESTKNSGSSIKTSTGGITEIIYNGGYMDIFLKELNQEFKEIPCDDNEEESFIVLDFICGNIVYTKCISSQYNWV